MLRNKGIPPGLLAVLFIVLRILLVIVLMIVFCRIKHRRRQNLCHYRKLETAANRHLLPGSQCSQPLLFRIIEYRRAVLRSRS